MILERVRRCRFCRREMSCSALSYAENPFCTECFDERVQATAPPEPVEWRLEGDYLKRVDLRTPSSGGPARRDH